ncbi:MAG: Ppx/GppA family phosphatase [Cyanobacteria bacterium KgW148]|nr:Ppx/GppA family phosphatase [Cyanobacteria bacterium KgW148]
MGGQVLAAIDVGTNSIHMVVAQINHQLPSFTIVSTEKETVRLGEGRSDKGHLNQAAIDRALAALSRFRQVCDTLGATEIVAVATSASREAPNGQELIDRVAQRTGIKVDLISGQEEARLIYLGVLSAMELNHQSHLIIDIGGGSTELVLGDGHAPSYLSSSKVGAVRLTEMFVHSDPISNYDFHQLQSYIQGIIERPIEDLKPLLGKKIPPLIGCSGTIEAVLSLFAKETTGIIPNPLQGYTISFEAVSGMVQLLRRSNLAERILLVKEKRAEIVLAGATILQEVMRGLQLPRITYCQAALREGLIVDWMIKHGLIQDRWRYQSSVRERSVLKLAHKYKANLPYSKQVAKLCLSLFDQTQGILHRWGQEERQLVWAGALLHNVGHFISHSEHHKHSYYLIRYGELLGYTESEIEVIANLARYHRRSEPKRKHEHYRRLHESQQLLIDQICPLLRLAVALDRRQIGAISDVKVTIDRSIFTLRIFPSHPEDPCTLELWSLEYKKELFEKYYNLTLAVVVDPSCGVTGAESSLRSGLHPSV